MIKFEAKPTESVKGPKPKPVKRAKGKAKTVERLRSDMTAGKNYKTR